MERLDRDATAPIAIGISLLQLLGDVIQVGTGTRQGDSFLELSDTCRALVIAPSCEPVVLIQQANGRPKFHGIPAKRRKSE